MQTYEMQRLQDELSHQQQMLQHQTNTANDLNR